METVTLTKWHFYSNCVYFYLDGVSTCWDIDDKGVPLSRETRPGIFLEEVSIWDNTVEAETIEDAILIHKLLT